MSAALTAVSRRERRALARRSRARARRKAALTATLIVGAATLAGVSAAGGTYALLSAQSELVGTTLQAGTLDLRINDTDQLGQWQLSPATPHAQAFTITNIGDAPAHVSAGAVVTSTTPIGAYVNARLTALDDQQACVAGLSGTMFDLAVFAAPDLGVIAAGETTRYCLELSLDAGTPSAYAGQGVDFAMTFSGVQDAP